MQITELGIYLHRGNEQQGQDGEKKGKRSFHNRTLFLTVLK